MNHDHFVGMVQHRARLGSRGDTERAIRATLETLGERLQPHSAAHIAAQLPIELGRHMEQAERFEHLKLEDFVERVALREGVDPAKAEIHAQAVMETLREALSPGAWDKLSRQLPDEYRTLLGERLHPA